MEHPQQKCLKDALGDFGCPCACKLVAKPLKVRAPDVFLNPFGTTWPILVAILDPAGPQRAPQIHFFDINF